MTKLICDKLLPNEFESRPVCVRTYCAHKIHFKPFTLPPIYKFIPKLVISNQKEELIRHSKQITKLLSHDLLKLRTLIIKIVLQVITKINYKVRLSSNL
ncbi:hypothetical protein HanXRQr2_Chr05g0208451 [Helianthus annuus]|uniref:Uncharacterized protein n=1 Tax=Helianthus annuus TaxID=4232 RepID=A0A9K3IYY0_HELAN|nr:hypothetical protein HanXRQr2_Chr05g0208451 [Helianthus annuus]KAJ0922243.1 hypothetical protein HanPSC8_Chr05g0201431 [Helianthus annuus]